MIDMDLSRLFIEASQNPVDTEKADVKDTPDAIPPFTITDSLADLPTIEPTGLG